MFVKRATKIILAKKFKEDKTIEFQMKGCKESEISLTKKETKQPPKRGLLLTRPIGKEDKKNTEKEGVDMEILQKLIKKLSHEIVETTTF